jgi:hypothetical protein
MTRKDYQLIADALKRAMPQFNGDKDSADYLYYGFQKSAWRDCVDEIAAVCKKDNPAFKHSLFHAACGSIPKDAIAGVRFALGE